MFSLMSLLLGRIVRYAAKQLVLNPKARAAATNVARRMASEAKIVAQDENRARAAGRLVRRVIGRPKPDR
jgi:hypothetical protein